MWWTLDMFLVMLSGLSGGEYCGSVECNLLSLWSPIYNWTLVFGISGILSRRNILQEDLLYKLPSLLVTKVELTSLFQHKYIFPIKKNKKISELSSWLFVIQTIIFKWNKWSFSHILNIFPHSVNIFIIYLKYLYQLFVLIWYKILSLCRGVMKTLKSPCCVFSCLYCIGDH